MNIEKWLNAWKKKQGYVPTVGEEFLKIPGYFGDPNAGMFVAFVEKATKMGMLSLNMPEPSLIEMVKKIFKSKKVATPTLVGKRFKNLTPHPVMYRDGSGKDFTFPSEGSARVDVTPGTSFTHQIGGLGMFEVNTPAQMGEVIGLPEPDGETIYIVSLIVITHPSVVGRNDVVAPATGPKDNAIRDAEGRIQGVTKFVRA